MVYPNGLSKKLATRLNNQTKTELVEDLLEAAYLYGYDLSNYLDEVIIYKLLKGRVPSDPTILKAFSFAINKNGDYESLFFDTPLTIHEYLYYFFCQNVALQPFVEGGCKM